MKRFVVITGLSGSGKSLAGDCLEDLGYFCVDNLPVQLIPPFYELIERSGAEIPRASLVIDVRGRDFLDKFPEILANLRRSAAPVDVLFFECSDEVLKRRYSESRRPHPMSDVASTLDEALAMEREALSQIRDLADRIIDTSRFTVHQFRNFMQHAFDDPGGREAMNVNITSFGFKYGLPTVSDLAFDVRFLPNPYFQEDLRALPGTSPEVRAFLDDQSETHEFMAKLTDMMDFLIPHYAAEGKSYLTVSIGCTGGKHRSVALAEMLATHLSAAAVSVTVNHRDLGRE
jgi:UPF0042 nucleotide-binding protein